MSGASVPYHLRPNKYVDRQLFIEALAYVSSYKGLDKYSYIAMGGRYLEDFKVIHSVFQITKMMSIEYDQLTWTRQNFNQPFSFICCQHMDSSELVQQFDKIRSQLGQDNCVVWLDYTAALDRIGQIREFEALVGKLSDGDVAKITLNASPSTFTTKERHETDQTYRTRLRQKIVAELGDYFPGSMKSLRNMTRDGIPKILAAAIKKAATQGIYQGTGSPIVKPLILTKYRDGQQMLTVTLVVLDRSSRVAFSRRSRINRWTYRSITWNDVKEISVPDLSLKERFAIDKDLFSGSEQQAHDNLPFRFATNARKSFQIYQNYREHYRRYPTFLRVEI